MPLDLIDCPNFIFTKKMEEQLFMFDFLHAMIRPSSHNSFSLMEGLYNSKIFYSKQKEVIIDHIKEERNNTTKASPFRYLFNKNGMVLRISELNNLNYKFEFTYDLANRLTSHTSFSTSLEVTRTEGHDITHHTSKQVIDKSTFYYENGLLKKVTYSLGFPEDIYYFKSAVDSSIFYIKRT